MNLHKTGTIANFAAVLTNVIMPKCNQDEPGSNPYI